MAEDAGLDLGLDAPVQRRRIAARRARLQGLLPRVYGDQPPDSAVGVVLTTLAAALARLDHDLDRVSRDHWAAYARGVSAPGEAPAPLDALGQLLGVPRLRGDDPQAPGGQESTDAYRRRLTQVARVVTAGLTSPRALLELALAILGAAPCPRLRRELDATVALGMPPSLGATCTACAGGTLRGAAALSLAPCPHAGREVVAAWLVDNPPEARRLVLGPLVPGDAFVPESAALDADVPVVAVRALTDRVQYPVLHNRATGEICLYAGALAPGETLSLWPRVEPAESARLDSFEPVGHHPWRAQYPQGSAVVLGADGQLRDVRDRVYYLVGDQFDKPSSVFASPAADLGTRFADALAQGAAFAGPGATGPCFADAQDRSGPCFASSSHDVRTPLLRPGADTWVYRAYTRADIGAIATADPGPVLDEAPPAVVMAPVQVTLRWWARPPACFRLRIPRTGWVRDAERRGAVAALRELLRQARPAGVQARLDFPEPVYREAQPLGDAGLRVQTRQVWGEAQGQAEGRLGRAAGLRLAERQGLADERLTIPGVFDRTPLDWSGFSP
ncbi:hypothetical protein [uncultured Thiodictyon sp.]|uniref:hypothetical protein n=1 Tax=uncultured Thiodictyon sp. TaxID=1846217 RepID=UPI0025FD5101|nr:hypothetical protein [uncultured Thiodictyon sp.]